MRKTKEGYNNNNNNILIGNRFFFLFFSVLAKKHASREFRRPLPSESQESLDGQDRTGWTPRTGRSFFKILCASSPASSWSSRGPFQKEGEKIDSPAKAESWFIYWVRA